LHHRLHRQGATGASRPAGDTRRRPLEAFTSGPGTSRRPPPAATGGYDRGSGLKLALLQARAPPRGDSERAPDGVPTRPGAFAFAVGIPDAAAPE
jgi:hypothetical protein